MNKRKDILAAALQLFVERGEQSTSMRCVGKAANCGIGTMYNYFHSKDDLISELYLSVKKDLFESILLTRDMKLPVKKQFYQIWHSVITYALTYPKEYTFLEAFSYSPKISEEVNKQIAELIRPLLRLFELGKQEGIIKNIKCSQMLIFTSGAISSSILKHMLTGDKEKEQLILMAWDAIKN
jgi:AcrR family transcriptional regulator